MWCAASIPKDHCDVLGGVNKRKRCMLESRKSPSGRANESGREERVREGETDEAGFYFQHTSRSPYSEDQPDLCVLKP